MADFSSDNLTNPGIDVQGIQRNALNLQADQQNLDDRATFRTAAPGLLAKDPTATGQAMGANPQAAQAFLSSIPQMDENTRLQASSDIAASGSLAGAVLNAPPEQRQAAWDAGRQTLIASGHKMVPPAQYPGDDAAHSMRGIALTAQQQFEQQANVPTTNPQPPMSSTPGGGYVGPGGVVGQRPSAQPNPAAQAAPGGQQSQGTAQANPALAATENPGGNPATMNKQGYVGNYQFGAGRLASLGMYQPGQGESVSGNTFNSPQSWTGQFSIPGYPQVKTLQDFRQSPGAQDAAYGVHDGDIRSAIAATPGAQNFDPNGLVAVAHLGGVGGMQRFVASGGQFNPGDSNGTTLQAYYKKFSGQPTQVAANVPPGGVANDASGPPQGGAPGPVAPQANATALTSAIDRLRTPAPQAAAGQPQIAPPAGAITQPTSSQIDPSRVVNVDSLSAASSFPAGTPLRTPDGQITVNPGGAMQYGAAPGPQAAPVPQPPSQPASATPPTYGANGTPTFSPSPSAGMNALASVGAPPAAALPNALSGMGQPAAQTVPQQNQLALVGQPQQPPAQSAPTSNQAPPGSRFLFQNYKMIPIPEQPGYARAQAPDGSMVAMRIPGAPGAGVDVQNVAGHQYVTDKQTGQQIADRPIANALRTTTVAGPNGTIVMQGSQQVGTIPFSTQPAQIAAYQRDSDVVTKVAQQNTAAEQSLQQTLEARNLAKGLPTGAGGEDRAALAGWLKTYAPEGVYQAALSTGFVPNSPQAEQVAKLLLRGAATDEQSLGGSGGLGMTEKFQKANANLNMQPESIQSILNLKAVTAQAGKDYGDGATAYFNGQQDNILHQGGQYQPLSNFNQQWHSQQNVGTYMAAIDAMNGKPYAEWSRALAPADQDRALSIIGRIDPTTTVNGPRGPISVMKGGGQQQSVAAPSSSAAPAVGTMMQGYRFNGGDPSSPASWARAQ